jgi:hypothetical protein
MAIRPLDTRIFTVILSRSVRNGVFPLPVRCGGLERKTLKIYETSISTVEDSSQAAARLFESQFHQEWQGHFGQSPPRGPQAFDPGLSEVRPWRLNRGSAACLGAKCT